VFGCYARGGGGSGEPLGRIGVRREKSGDNNEEKNVPVSPGKKNKTLSPASENRT